MATDDETQSDELDIAVATLLKIASTETAVSLLARWIAAVRPELYGAVADGATDSTVAIQTALDAGREVVLSPGVYVISSRLNVPAGSSLRGSSSGNFGLGASAPRSIIQVASNTASEAVFMGEKSNVTDILLRPANDSAVSYQAANYPTGTGNAAIGLRMADSATATRVVATAFSEAGFITSNRARLDGCFAGRCDIGFKLSGPDGNMTNSVATFCQTAGADVTANYWRIIGSRFEWNARYGLRSAGECSIVGNLFDRNGWAGLELKSGSWGQVVTGNYFSRNGAGGNGTTGRWGVSVPGHMSYVETTAAQSCHILVNYQRGVTITANRFRAGDDDANQGANAPNYIYSSSSSNGATALSAIALAGNAGVYDRTDDLGYNADLYGADSGAIAGGSDNTLSAYLNKSRAGNAVFSAIVPTSEAANASTHSIYVRKGSSGRVIFYTANSASCAIDEIYFTRNRGTTGAGVTTSASRLGTSVINSTSLNDSTSISDLLTVVLSSSRYANWFIEYAN